MTEKLTPKQSAFVQEYLKDLNATQAAIRAGYSERTANEQGSRLLANVSVRDAIDAAKQQRSERTQIDADWLLTRLADEIEADIAELYDEHTGALKPVHKWPKIFRQGLVAGIDVNQLTVDGRSVGEVVKVKLADRNAIKKMIGDHVGVQAFKQFVDHQHTHKFADLTEEQLNAKIAELQRKAGAG